MSRVVLEPAFTAVGCNVVSSCLEWGPSFAAFGAGNAVALFSLEKNAVVATLGGAGEAIHKVRWLSERTLFAVCNKGLLVIELEPGRRVDEAVVTFKTVQVGEGQQFHGLSVVADARGKGEALVVLVGTHVVSFQYSTATRMCEQLPEVLPLPARQLSECTAAALLPRLKVALVAVGGADRRVHLYLDDKRQGLCYVSWLEGHQDWIRDLSFSVEAETGDLLLASCSSDSFMRLWRVARFVEAPGAGVGAVQESENRQKIVFAANDHKGNAPLFAASLDALLVGHSHFVHSVAWSKDGKNLISASMDKTMIVWEKDPEDQIWVDRFRVGEIGGNALGFFGASFSPDGSHVLGHSYNGSLHLWARKKNAAAGFEPKPTVSGHLRHVTDIAWDPKGRYFVSASLDQTVRLWAPWVEGSTTRGWFELARPQIHGHDINAVTLLAGPQEHVLVSGAEEKTIRVFGGTDSFVSSLLGVSGAETGASAKPRPFGATLPPLGLSNKPLYTAKDASAADEARLSEAFPDEVWRAHPEVLAVPPVETQLAQSTLWVEEQKLYGHGSELYAITSSHDGALVASACKGKAKPHTDVLLWKTSDWTLACRLSRHKMTVTRIVFSHSDEYIATVSRDLRLCLWRRKEKGLAEYDFVWEQEKAHQRIIWDCCWSPDDSMLFTCSRDKKICVWNLLAGVTVEMELANTVKRSVPLTSIAYHPTQSVLAVGNDTGAVGLWRVNGSKWLQLAELNIHNQLPVSRLAFKLVPSLASVMLLSCGEDQSVRLTRVVITDAFSQLVTYLLCARALGTCIPQLVARMIHRLL